MAALTNLSDRIAQMTSGSAESSFYHKGLNHSSLDAGALISLWCVPGYPGAAPTPTTVAACSSSTAGALRFTDPAGGKQKWLVYACMGTTKPGTTIFYDRLLHIGGLSGTSTSAQTVGGSITRYTNGVGNIAYLEIYTSLGTSNVTATLSYTNDLNASVTSTVTVGGSGTSQWRKNQMVIPFPLNSGESGVKAVTSVQLSGSTGTAGNFGITIGHPLTSLTFYASSEISGGAKMSTIHPPGDIEIPSGACLAMFHRYFNALTVSFYAGMLGMVEK